MIILVPALALTLATFLLACIKRGWLAYRKRPAPRFWRKTLLWHAGLLVLHSFVTVPVGLGVLGAHWVGTRRDEQGWKGPRIGGDGEWRIQSRDSLEQERLERLGTREPGTSPDRLAELDELDHAAERRALHFPSRDGVKLRAFLVPARAPRENDPRFAAVLVHGLYRSGLEIETVGSMLRDLGGEVLLLELRGHGGSERAKFTFGRDEALDVLAAVDVLRARPEAAGRPLFLFGVSLGTAAVALAAPQVPDVAGLILDAPIDDLEATAKRLLSGSGGRRRAQGIPQPFRAIALWSAERLGGVPFDEVRPPEALARLSPRLPILLVAAGHDVRSPPEAVQRLYDELPTDPDRKELWLVPESEHGKVWVVAPDSYREHLARFLDEALAPGR